MRILLPFPLAITGEVYQMDNSGPRQFDFGVIRDATSNFSRANELGRGGFGVVYKVTTWKSVYPPSLNENATLVL